MASIFVRVLGAKKLDSKLRKLPVGVRGMLQKQIASAAIAMVSDIKDNMRKQKSGRIRRTGTIMHQASTPGDYPAVDTGDLISGVTFEIATGGLDAVVGTNVTHGVHLEFGTVNMAARPWLSPSFKRVMAVRGPIINKSIKAAILKVAKR